MSDFKEALRADLEQKTDDELRRIREDCQAAIDYGHYGQNSTTIEVIDDILGGGR